MANKPTAGGREAEAPAPPEPKSVKEAPKEYVSLAKGNGFLVYTLADGTKVRVDR